LPALAGRRIIDPMDRTKRAALIWLALYAVFLGATPFEHHDLACELKTPLHCLACTSSLVAREAVRPAPINASIFTDLGLAFSHEVTSTGTLLPSRLTGRSPPALT
jgi:hypothetical protein